MMILIMFPVEVIQEHLLLRLHQLPVDLESFEFNNIKGTVSKLPIVPFILRTTQKVQYSTTSYSPNVRDSIGFWSILLVAPTSSRWNS